MLRYRAPYAARHDRVRRETERQMNQIAELVAEGETVKSAAEAMGLSQSRGSQLWCKIRKRLNVPVRD